MRSLNKKRQLENISIFDFELSADEIIAIDNININSRLRYDPDNCDFLYYRKWSYNHTYSY